MLLEAYQTEANASLSSVPWLSALQKKALNQLGHSGLPSRKDEEWKYTSLSAVTGQVFTRATEGSATLPDWTQQEGLSAYPTLTCYKGVLSGFQELAQQLPKGALVLPLEQACRNQAKLVKPYLDQILQPTHGFHYLNSAFIQQGFFIYLPEGVVLTEPVIIRHFQDTTGEAVYWRHLICAEKDSALTLVEDYCGAPDCNYLTNTLTEVTLAANAKLSHYKVQREGNKACHIGHLAVQQAKDSNFESHSLSLGGQLVRSDLGIALAEEGAQCLMNGIYAPKEGQHIDHHTTVMHSAASCISRQDYKGLLSGASRAVFNGKIIVEPGAQHTDAQQQNKNLLLSKQAEIDTKPQLEIYADDVQCSHGATVGRLDEDALFYLATRGINEASAQQYLIQAFIQENLRLVLHQGLADWMRHLLIQHME